MKKLLYLFLTVSLIFSSCKKEDEVVTPTAINGCTDSQATNYNANANADDSSCLYEIAGVWQWESPEAIGYSNIYSFFWPTGEYAMEYYDATNTAVRVTIGTFSLSSNQQSCSITDLGYNLVNGTWVPDALEVTTSFTITKFNGSELDVTNPVVSAELNKTSIPLPDAPSFLADISN